MSQHHPEGIDSHLLVTDGFFLEFLNAIDNGVAGLGCNNPCIAATWPSQKNLGEEEPEAIGKGSGKVCL